jgi:hypothetical protein
MTKTPSPNENAGGFHSKNDPQQGDLRDERQGTYDTVGNQKLPDTNQQTEHERAQPGADVRGEPVPTKNLELPEGLKRQRMGPYDRMCPNLEQLQPKLGPMFARPLKILGGLVIDLQ